MPQPNSRFLYVRLPGELLDALEEARYHSSRRVGKRVPLRALVQTALQDFITELRENRVEEQALDARVFIESDEAPDAEALSGET